MIAKTRITFVAVALGILSISIHAVLAEPIAPAPNDLKPRIHRVNMAATQAFGAFLVLIEPRQRRLTAVSPGAKDFSEFTALFQKLYLGAFFTKELSVAVCEEEATKALCAKKFNPPWLTDPNSLHPTYEALSSWTTETETAIEPLRRGLCDLAGQKKGDPKICDKPEPEWMRDF